MSWFKETAKTINMEEIGYPEIEIKLKNIKAMTYNQAKEIQKKFDTISAEEVEEGSEEDTNMESLGSLLAEMVISWNIPPLDGEINVDVLPIPSVDRDVVKSIPMAVLNVISKKMQEDSEDIPNTNGS